MFDYLSKLLPIFVYPLGLACLLIAGALIIGGESAWSKRFNLIALLLLYVSGNTFITTAIVHSLESQYPPLDRTPKADVIVVLGGGARHQSPPRLTAEVNEAGDRLLYAARLYHASAAPIILVSGGNSKWSGPITGSGADAMSEILQLAGVPEDAILLEDFSSNTYENAVQSVEILETLKVKNVILVTSAMHMPRSVLVFSAFDLELTPAPTDYYITDKDRTYLRSPDFRIQIMNLLPTANNLNLTSLAMKEYIGIIVYRLRNWI